MLIDTIYSCCLNACRTFQKEREHFTALSAFLLALSREYGRIAKRHGLRPFGKTLHLRLRHSEIKLYLRTEASDYSVFRQIFIENEYAPLDDLTSVATIVDCGANVGYSSLYFLNRFPQAHLIAIEPDPGNALLCEQNLRPYGNRATVIKGAIWPQKARLAIVRGEYRDGGEWATQVQPLVTPSGSTMVVEGFDMPDILEMLKGPAIDILKIDIERSEIALFGSDTKAWLSRVRNIAIELHDDECRRVFQEALSSYNFGVQHSGELTIIRNLQAASNVATPVLSQQKRDL